MATRVSRREFPQALKYFKQPVLATTLVIFTELVLANPALESAFAKKADYKRAVLGLVKYILNEVQGKNSRLPRMLISNTQLTTLLVLSLERVDANYEQVTRFMRDAEQLNAHHSRELYQFIEHLAGRRRLPIPDSHYDFLKQVTEAVRTVQASSGFSRRGPALFWDAMDMPEIQKLLCLPSNPRLRARCVKKAVSSLCTLPPSLFNLYEQEISTRLAG